MKNLMIPIVVLSFLITVRPAFSQSLSDYVKELRGDTLVIKSYAEMNNQPDALYQVLTLDTIGVPSGRVYELEAGGWYPLLNTPMSHPNRTTMIVGSDPTMLVNNKNAASSPPLISGAVTSYGWGNTGAIVAKGDLTIKNSALVPAAPDGNMGWDFVVPSAPQLNLLFDNVLFERTRWIFVYVDSPKTNVTFRNCYFVNMTGQPCRRSGGVFDCFCDMDTLRVENCTHINACGSLYRLRPFDQFKRTIINHNTFINCTGSVFMNPGTQSNVSLTNNIFVNSNIQSFPGIQSIDTGELDLGWLPMGLVNAYPDSLDVANNTPRRFLCQNNLAYWDPSLSDMDSILIANKVDNVTTWRSQMIVMNSRTDSMFKHLGPYAGQAYSSLQTDTWKNQMPHFSDPRDLFSTQLGIIKAYALATVDTGAYTPASLLPDWRLVNATADEYINPDWPIPVDLSYSDADLKTGGIGGFPLGDLNWFPTQKAAWLAQSVSEYATIDGLMSGDIPVDVAPGRAALPGDFRLEQNYPNPFNPTTGIRCQVSEVSWVRLVVYDLLGREVAILADGRYPAGKYTFRFDGSRFASGMYIYRLTAGPHSAARTMTLLK